MNELQKQDVTLEKYRHFYLTFIIFRLRKQFKIIVKHSLV